MNTFFAWARSRALISAGLLLVPACVVASAQQAATTYHTSLSIAHQSRDAKGHSVVILQSAGDLPGVLTLVLSTSPDGSITGGEWALNVSYTAPLNPDTQPVPDSPDPDSAQGEQLIQKGTLSGTIAAGSVAFSGDQIAAINSLQLALHTGSMQFATVSSGSGSVSGTYINDRANSAGFVTLTF